MLKRGKRSLKGMTLIEIMIALVLNGLLLTAIVSIFSVNIKHYSGVINASRLDQEMQLAMLLMTNDIRRAGYYANAANDIGTGANNNPFMSTGSGTDIQVPNSQCILFTYDHDSNGSIASVSAATDDEHYGFRLSNQIIQARPPGATFSCTAPASEWENITDSKVIQITALTFTLNQTTIITGPSTKGITIRSVDIVMTGQLAQDSSVTKTLTEHVRVINDKYIP